MARAGGWAMGGLHAQTCEAPHLSSSAVALTLSSGQLREDHRPSLVLQKKGSTMESQTRGVRTARAHSRAQTTQRRASCRAPTIEWQIEACREVSLSTGPVVPFHLRSPQ